MHKDTLHACMHVFKARYWRTGQNHKGSVFAAMSVANLFSIQMRYVDKGRYVEYTSKDECTGCGTCLDVCYFKARMLTGETIELAQNSC